jgi:hypothetical protein
MAPRRSRRTRPSSAPLQPIVEDVPRRARHLRPTHHQLILRLALPPQRHRHPPRSTSSKAAPAISSTGCEVLLTFYRRSMQAAAR